MPPKYEVKAKERIRRGVQKYASVLQEASQKGINEEDTSVVVHSMIVEMLGYEALREVNAQYRVRGQSVDWAVRVGDELKFFVEVKALGKRLRESHLAQVETYARREPGVEWAVLTTADVWQCHHISDRAESEQFFEVRLTDPTQSVEQKVQSLYLLTKESISRGILQKEWEQTECYRPEKLARLLLSIDVLRVVRRLVKRENPGRRIDMDGLREHLMRSVIRGDIPTESLKLIQTKTRSKPATRIQRKEKTERGGQLSESETHHLKPE